MASTKLSRTAGTPTSSKKFTISFWVKRSNIGSAGNGHIFDTYVDSSNRSQIHFDDDNVIDFRLAVSGSNIGRLKTNRVFRDVGAFYHIMASVDTTLATADDRVKLFINGVQETSFSTRTNPSQNADFPMNGTHTIGAYGGGTNYFDGTLSYFAFVDGTQYDPSYLGETDSSSGIWKIKTSPSVTYGTNGFFLKMDTSSPGTDTSGNSNTFTASGTPTLTQDNASNNFATMNSLDNYYAGSTFTNGNLSIATVTGNDTYNNATMGYSTGKWYWETKIIQSSTYDQVGITSKGSIATNNYMSNSLYSVVIKQDGNLWQNAGSGSGAVGGWSGTSWTTGDIIGIAHDATNNKIYVHKNGTYMNSGNPTTGSNGADTTASSSTDTGVWLPAVGDEISSGTASQFALNFGNGFFGTTAVASSNADAAGYGLFEYAVPTGYYTLCTKNLNTYG